MAITAARWRGWPFDTEFFDPRRPVTLTRAPGRLDVMGGIADYSGALVLEMPIAAATWVAAQPSDEPEVVIESDDIGAADGCGDSTVTLPLADIVPELPLTYERAHALLTADPRRAWAAYAAGALVVLHAELGKPLRHGLRLLVWSEVPVGKGLSSSAALEVATLEAVAPLVGATLKDREHRAARAEGRELRRRRALRRDGSDDVRARPPRSPARARSVSPRRWSGSCGFPTTSSSSASTRGSVTRSPAPTTERSAPRRSWVTA